MRAAEHRRRYEGWREADAPAGEVIAVVLGIGLLGEALSVMKLGGITLAGIAIYLLSSE